MIAIKILKEGFIQAIHQLLSNKTRSFLSVLGIAIGVFCIISVLSAVNSLEADIRGSFKRLGDDVLYIDKMPWGEDPNENYWKYIRRPSPSYDDFNWLEQNLSEAEMVSMYFFIGMKGIKYLSNQVTRVPTMAVTYDIVNVYNVEFSAGRWYSPFEFNNGADMIVLGSDVAEQLFGPIDPIGKVVKLKGRKLKVIGVTKKVGNSLVNPMNFDICALTSYSLGKELANLKADNVFGSTSIQIKAKSGVDLKSLEDDVVVNLRKRRRLRPIEKNDFAVNTLSIISRLFDTVFGVMASIGWIIGGLSILVGGFSVANIMFVSVKERTNIIGIKKALGAKRSVILYEFLVEAIILCIIGGIVGLGFVYLIMKVLSKGAGFDLFLNMNNVFLGVGGSIFIGILAGIIPAYIASKMDPVIAIRSK